MAGNKKKKNKYTYITKAEREKEKRAENMRCVYCGKWIGTPPAPFYAKANTREFPVCSEQCKLYTENYVHNDKTYKVVLYLAMFIAAIGVFIGALFSQNPNVVYPCVAGAGLAMFAFPYPISSFETFFHTPIKKVTFITRTVGIIILGIGLFFFITLR